MIADQGQDSSVGDERCTAPTPTQAEPEVQMTIKGTFIELVAKEPEEGRCRAMTDSVIVNGTYDGRRRKASSQGCPLEILNESSEVSTEFQADPDDCSAKVDTPMLWPSLPSDRLTAQHAEALPPLEEPYLPAPWSGLDGQDWLMPPAFAAGYNCGASAVAFDGSCLMPAMDPVAAAQWDQWGMDSGASSCSPAVEPMNKIVARTTGKATSRAQAGASLVPEAEKTTVLLRNLPRDYTRTQLIELLEDEGFDGTFDFVYVPMDFSSEASLGYAFVNFTAPGDARRCWEIFDGLVEWGQPGENRACEVMWAEPCQGLAAHVERYRSSPVMHASVPDEWKPAIFQSGVRMPFPPPLKTVSAPKVRRRAANKEDRG
mmetsp:Transcript_126693/g.253186  ORF Transcript_126693/g.253186 Transcript_126693/m.253186 type:complete len:373 (-) Transcript_126693:161-1279(-)